MAEGVAGMMALIAALTKAGDVAHTADGCYNRLGIIKIPVLVAQEHSDVMIPTVNSYQLSQNFPNAWLLIYPDPEHGYLFQFPEQFTQQVNEFLDGGRYCYRLLILL
jgi:pimeloyl-ACP methyl ester carboxylesterase